MVKQIVMPRRLAAAVLIAALASGCGIKGPLVPAPTPTAETPAAKDAAPAEKKP